MRRSLSYVAGFVLSIILTLVAYGLVSQNYVQGWTAVYTLSALAVIQLLVQLLFFLHLSRHGETHTRLMLFDFTLVVVIIVVAGTLWIMHNLHYNAEPIEVIEQQIIHDEGVN